MINRSKKEFSLPHRQWGRPKRRDITLLSILMTTATIWAATVSTGQAGGREPDKKILRVEDFGATGDGQHDDIGALVQAIDALKAMGPGGTLEFSAGKTYRLGLRDDGIFQLDLQNMTNATVNGNGAMMLTTPQQASIRLKHCDGVTVKNLVIEQSPLAFTQGTIERIVPEEGFFEMKIVEGYDLLPSDTTRKEMGFPGWDWGSILDPKLRRIRWDTRDHFRVERIDPITERTYRVHVLGSFKKDLEQVRPGDIYFQPLHYNDQARLVRIKEGRYAANIHVTNSKDCLIENVTLYSGRSSMTSRIDLNDGRITFRGFKIMFRPGTDRIVTNWRDGIHCKDNRIGPIIENCYFEGMLDDSINLSQNTLMASEIISDTTFRMTKAEGPKHWTRDASSVWKGDELMVFYPESGEYVGPIKVVHVDENAPEIITFESPVANVVTGTIRPGADENATHFYNMNMCNAGFVVRNNVFKPQRRHAVLVRSPNGLIENNTIEEVGGHGIVLENEYGYFYEGPFPRNVTIRNNTIKNTHLSPISLSTHAGDSGVCLVSDIQIEGNTITSSIPGIKLSNVANVVLKKNHFYDLDGKEMETPIEKENSISGRFE